jgi:hypothetical protein
MILETLFVMRLQGMILKARSYKIKFFFCIPPQIFPNILLLQDINAPKSFRMNPFCNLSASNFIRTNPAFPPLKSTIQTYIIENEIVIIYVYIKNYRQRLHPRIPAALGFVCGLLRRVGGGAVFGAGFLFFIFFILILFFL